MVVAIMTIALPDARRSDRRDDARRQQRPSIVRTARLTSIADRPSPYPQPLERRRAGMY